MGMAVPLVTCGPEQDGTQGYSEPNSTSTKHLCPDPRGLSDGSTAG